MKGRKPRADFLKLVAPGTHSKRPKRIAAPVATGHLQPPYRLSGRVAEIWREIVAVADWLGPADAFKLAGFCVLEAQFEEMGRAMLPSLISQWRGLASDLALDPIARLRLGVTQKSEPDPADAYLGPRIY
jgi:phage terminase small subunit